MSRKIIKAAAVFKLVLRITDGSKMLCMPGREILWLLIASAWGAAFDNYKVEIIAHFRFSPTTADLYTLLLEDILVLLQKQDDRLVLRCHSKILANTADSKHTFSPVIKLNTVLVRQVATG